ncbi:MAG: MarR family transcriptional regulator [Anaerolineae bacterium]|nr:MarR family transcriptional regulator [Anaerolineae bacterium]
MEDIGSWPAVRLLMKAMKLHRGNTHAKLEGLGLYRGQAAILSALWNEEGIAQTEIAVRTWVSPATMTHALQRMEQVGLIERRRDAEDQRRSRVYLTDVGRALEAPVNRAWADIEGEMLDGFSSEEETLLRQFLMRMIALMEKCV